MTDLLDILFRFPNMREAGPGFVTSVLCFFSTPVMVVDRKLKVHFINLQGQDMLFRFEKGAKGGHAHGRGGRGKTLLPGTLRDPIRTCLAQGETAFIRDFAAPGVRSDRYDIALCPGEIEGARFCFLLMLRPYASMANQAASGLASVLESISGCALFLDTEARFQAFNRHYLEAFGLEPEEILGTRISEVNPSKQAGILESQIRHLMSTGTVRNSSADSLTTAKRGIMITSILAWPVSDKTGGCRGLFALAQPSPSPAPLPLLDDKTKDLFGQTAVRQGPPMFFTHMDGKIITMNMAARDLVGPGREGGPDDLRSALPWLHPEIIDQLYSELLGGLKSTQLHTELDTPTGKRIFLVQAVGLKEIGDITSIVLVHLQDVTELENSKNLLARTARRLATEKDILDRVITDLQSIKLTYLVADRDLNVIRVNGSVLATFGKGADFFIGKKIYEIDPGTRENGIIAFIKTAMERGRSIRIQKFRYSHPAGGEVILSLAFHPIYVDGKQACLIAGENLTEREAGHSRLAERSKRLQALLDNSDEGVAILDRKGAVLDVNRVICRAARMSREAMIGKNEREVMMAEEGDFLVDFRRRAVLTRQPVSTGCIKLTSKVRKAAVFADISYIPLLNSEGGVQEILAIVRYLTDVINLEKKVEEYTSNLERLVHERTSELSSANEELGATVAKLASMAQSGLVMSSMKDMESVMKAFLEEAQAVTAADFVSVAIVAPTDGASTTTYFSRGTTPPPGAIPSDLIERKLASLTLDTESPEQGLDTPNNILVHEFRFASVRGLVLAWKAEGEFSTIDWNLNRLLCTQLGFAVPVTRYVGDLRTERDRSRCLRRIAYRTAGSTSVSTALGIVVEELSKVMDADRFFWLVSKSAGDIWLSEVRSGSHAGLDGRVHLSGEGAAGFEPILKACQESHSVFCDRFPNFGGGAFAPDGVGRHGGACSFADPGESGDLGRSLRRLLGDRGLINRLEGSLAVAPVMLSRRAYGLLCAYNAMGVPFTGYEPCFMCQAASTVGHMWQATDASSSIRRLEAEGETLSEIAHDLRYPLMRVREILEHAGAQSKANKKDMEAIGEIDGEIGTLNLLAEELIDISNRKNRQPEIIDVREVIDHCMSLMGRDVPGHSAEIRVDRAAACPPAFANRKDVKDILINVLANCVEAAGREGWVNVALGYVESGSNGGAIEINVTDSGPGVPEDLAGRIFDPFYTTKTTGKGIGLFSAKKRANANGGDVRCEVRDGRSRFVISLPLAT